MRTGSLSILGASVWNGDRFEERDVHIVDGAVADRRAEGATTLDGRGRWLIPGLIDAHFHAYATSQDGLEDERGPLSFAAINGTRRLGAALRRGFTTVRDVAGGDIGLARAIDADLFDSPRYLFTGPALSQTGGHGDPRSAHVDICFSHGHMCEIVDGLEPLRLAVRNRLRKGAHAIKVMTSGGVFSLTDPIRVPQYSAEELRAVIRDSLDAFGAVGAPSTWVLSNHDVVRHASRLALTWDNPQGDGIGPRDEPKPDGALGLARARAATTVMLSLPGSAYLYQGEELGLPEAMEIPDEFRQDPTWFRTSGERYGRDGCRVPLPWSGTTPSYGFNDTGASWLPQPAEWAEHARALEDGSDTSTLSLYKQLLELRRERGLGSGSLV
ncbi:MAG: hypothetical protein B7X40_09565, partial [Cellulomonas sp. 14-74-6]